MSAPPVRVRVPDPCDRCCKFPLPLLWLLAGLTFIGIILGAALFLAYFNPQTIKTISGVHPLAGELTLLAGPDGIALDLDDHSITVANTGVTAILTGTGVAASAETGDVTLTNTGVTSAVAGVGVAVSGPTGAVTFSNTGVLSVTAVGAGLSFNASTGVVGATNTGVTSAVAGAGISVSGATGAVTFTNAGVRALSVSGSGLTVNASTGSVAIATSAVLTVNSLSPTAGNIVVTGADGLVATSVGNTVTLADELSTQTTLNHDDALGPQVGYEVAIGFFTPVPENTWQSGVVAGFPVPYFPGAMGDGGQGGTGGGTWWIVPALGSYTITADCEVTPSALRADDHQSVSVALAFGAVDADPMLGGFIPFGGYATLDFSGGTNAATAPALARRLSFSTSFHAGCTGCPVALSDALTVHAYPAHTGIGAAVTADVYCRLQIERRR